MSYRDININVTQNQYSCFANLFIFLGVISMVLRLHTHVARTMGGLTNARPQVEESGLRLRSMSTLHLQFLLRRFDLDPGVVDRERPRLLVMCVGKRPPRATPPGS